MTARCAKCGYDLAGLADDAACPECALPVAMSHLRQPAPTASLRPVRRGLVLATISTILALLGPFFFFLLFDNTVPGWVELLYRIESFLFPLALTAGLPLGWWWAASRLTPQESLPSIALRSLVRLGAVLTFVIGLPHVVLAIDTLIPLYPAGPRGTVLRGRALYTIVPYFFIALPTTTLGLILLSRLGDRLRSRLAQIMCIVLAVLPPLITVSWLANIRLGIFVQGSHRLDYFPLTMIGLIAIWALALIGLTAYLTLRLTSAIRNQSPDPAVSSTA